MVWERYCNASPKPEFFLFSLFIFSFISQLIWVRLVWNFHRWFSIQKQVNWCTIDPFSLQFCTSQHSYPVPLISHFSHVYINNDQPRSRMTHDFRFLPSIASWVCLEDFVPFCLIPTSCFLSKNFPLLSECKTATLCRTLCRVCVGIV